MIGLVYVQIFCILLSFVSGSEELSSSNLIPCIEGAYLFGNKCYKVFGQTDRKTWTDASRSCKNLDGYLATIQTQELQDSLAVFMVLNERLHLWIGLHDRDQESKYTWDDGSIVNYTSWSPGEPARNLRSSEDCVEMTIRSTAKLGMWNDLPCDEELPFICQLKKTTGAKSPDSRFCTLEEGGGWKYSNSCYHIIEKKSSWEDAEELCEEEFDGHLVSILNSGTEMFLNYILPKETEGIWIGIKFRDDDIQKWSSGWHLVFNKWSYGQTLVNGTCGLRKSNQWISADCTEKHPFVCESSRHKAPVAKQREWRCPDGSKEWRDLDGDSCYILETTKSLNWNDANYDCMTKGGSLAVISTEYVSNAIHHHIVGHKEERLLIGLHRKLSSKHTFQWTDGTELDFKNWFKGEPNSISEVCGELWTDTMKWNDISCDAKKGYICSAKKLPPLVSEENQPQSHALQNEECLCQSKSDDTTFQAATIALACIIVFSLLIGIVIYLTKTHRIKDIPFSSLRGIIPDRTRFSDVRRSSDNLIK